MPFCCILRNWNNFSFDSSKCSKFRLPPSYSLSSIRNSSQHHGKVGTGRDLWRNPVQAPAPSRATNSPWLHLFRLWMSLRMETPQHLWANGSNLCHPCRHIFMLCVWTGITVVCTFCTLCPLPLVPSLNTTERRQIPSSSLPPDRHLYIDKILSDPSCGWTGSRTLEAEITCEGLHALDFQIWRILKVFRPWTQQIEGFAFKHK